MGRNFILFVFIRDSRHRDGLEVKKKDYLLNGEKFLMSVRKSVPPKARSARLQAQPFGPEGQPARPPF